MDVEVRKRIEAIEERMTSIDKKLDQILLLKNENLEEEKEIEETKEEETTTGFTGDPIATKKMIKTIQEKHSHDVGASLDEEELYELADKRLLTFEEFKWILESKVYSPAFIGHTVDLKNGDLFLTFKILEVDENGYDLICLNYEKESEFGDTNTYKHSFVREIINSEFLQLLPEEVLTHLQIMEVESNDEVLEDYAKLVSMTELGKSDEYYSIKKEGERYDLLNSNIFEKYIWTRSRSTDTGSYVWNVYDNGNVHINTYSASCTLAPVIRLG